MGKRPLNILHISDLHYRSASIDLPPILDALFEDLRNFSTTWLRPDLVAFTGDLTATGHDPKEYSAAFENFLYPLIDANKIEPSKLILTPGNHDVDRAVLEANKSSVEHIDAIVEDAANVASLPDTGAHQVFGEKFSNYRQISDVLADPVTRRERFPYFSHHRFDDLAGC